MSVGTGQPADAGPAARRGERLRAELAAARLECVVLSTPESVHYATGHRSLTASLSRGAQIAAVVTPSRTVLIVPAGEAAAAEEGGREADELVTFGEFYFTHADGSATSGDHPDLSSALEAVLAAPGRSRPAAEWAGFARTGRPAALADASGADGWIAAVRSVKLPGEQELLRTAARLAEQGIEAALGQAAAGVTERELAAAVAGAMVAGGGEPRFVVVTSGERSALSDAFPTDRACRPGDLVRFDVGCTYQGYWSDVARTAVVGEPTGRQQRFYDALATGQDAEFATATPGARAGDVFAAAVRGVEANGGPLPYRRQHAGHAIGLSVYETPLIASGIETVLRPGMVFCLETPYYELGWGGMMVEDTGVVTEHGFELFTTMDRGLRVIP
ncbi:Xaa-Pro peptidase family protein [Nonomuraea sp. B1E8]|uniref:Xaa-Pro peptidase family protein n=1 Tax=unclassified Nonomuraea TaxID=2593643 RepID=UPI00325DE60A